jgi:uncharacterized protein (DUF362 family)
MDRRNFLKNGLAVAAGSIALGGVGTACAKSDNKKAPSTAPEAPAQQVTGAKTNGKPRVSFFTDSKMRKDGGLDAGRVAELLSKTLAAAIGVGDGVAALRTVVSEKDVVGLKINCIAGRPLSPAHETIEALIALLGKVGVTPDRVIAFERSERDIRKGGFTVRTSGGPLFLGNNSPGAGFEDEPTISGSVGSCISRIVTQRVTVFINVGLVKDHALAGVAGGMKNLYGIIHNPNKYHDNGCDPFVADVLAFPVVQQKMRLSLLDGITAQCQDGPGYQPEFAWPLDSLLCSTDPVALDRIAWEVIEEQRKVRGLPTLTEAGRTPKWLSTAAARHLGVDDRQKIELVRGG